MTSEGRSTILELPPLGPEEALRLVHLLERLQSAIWTAHGHRMSELLLDRRIDRCDIDEDQLDLFDGNDDFPF